MSNQEQLDVLLREESSENGRARNVWFAAHDADGDLSGYQADVDQAWRHAEARSDRRLQDDTAPDIAREVRYALYTASVNSFASSIPAPLLAGLVRAQVWSPAQGMAYARRAPEGRVRAEALGELASASPPELMPELLDAVEALDNDHDRARALAELAVCLPEPLLRRAVRALPETDGRWNTAARARLAVRLGRTGQWDEAFALLSASPAAQAEAFTAAAADLPEDSLDHALEMVLAHSATPSGRPARALLPLLPHLDAAQAATVPSVALEGLEGAELLAALGDLAPRLPGPALGELRNVVRSQPPWVAAKGFAILGGSAKGAERADLVQEAWASIEAIDVQPSARINGWFVEPGPEEGWSRRADALGALLPIVDGREYQKARSEAETAAHAALRDAVGSVGQDTWTHLGGSSSSGPGTSTADPWPGAAPMRLAGKLAPGEAEELVESALAVVGALHDPSSRAWGLQSFLPDAPPAACAVVLARAERATASVPDPDDRIKLLLGLLRYAGAATRDRLVSGVLGALPGVEPASARLEFLGVVARFNTSAGFVAAVQREVARPEGLPAEALRQLSTLVPYMTAAGLDRLVSLAALVDDREARRAALAGVAPYLSTARRGAATVQTTDGVASRFSPQGHRHIAVLSRLARGLVDQGHAGEAIDVAEAIPHSDSVSPSARYDTLIALAEKLARSDPSAALAAAARIGRAAEYEKALTAVLAQVPGALIDDVLVRLGGGGSLPPAAQHVVHERRRRGSPTIPEDARRAPASTASRVASDSGLEHLRRAAGHERADLIVDIAGHLDAVRAREALELAHGIGDVWSTARAVRSIAARLVRLGLPDEATTAILRLSDLNDGWDDSPLRTALVAHVADLAAAGYLDEARSVALQLLTTNAWGEPLRASALTDLVRRYVRAGAARTGLECALTIRDDHERAAALDAFAEVAVSSPRPELLLVVRRVLRRAATLTRPALLIDVGALAPVIAQLGGDLAMDEVAEALDDVARWWP